MGEMADFANEYQEETMGQAYNYITGNMSDYEAFDNGIVDHQGVYCIPEYIIDDWPMSSEEMMVSLQLDEAMLDGRNIGGRFLSIGNSPANIGRVNAGSIGLSNNGKTLEMHKGMKDRLKSGKCLTAKQRAWIGLNIKEGWQAFELQYAGHANYSDFCLSLFDNCAKSLLNGRGISEKQKDIIETNYYGGFNAFCDEVEKGL